MEVKIMVESMDYLMIMIITGHFKMGEDYMIWILDSTKIAAGKKC